MSSGLLRVGQLTAEQRIQKAVNDIMCHPRYYALAGLLMYAKRTVVENHPTACTDGRDEKYGRAFVDSLTDPELRFLILHETYHRLYRHLWIWAHLWKLNPSLCNTAMDLQINWKIITENEDGFAVMPRDKQTGEMIGVYEEKYAGWLAGRIFWDMHNKLKEQPKQPQPQDGQPGQPQDGDGDGGSDGQPTDSGMSAEDIKKLLDKAGELDEHDVENANKGDPEEVKKVTREIEDLVRQGQAAAGKTGHAMDADITNLLKPKVNWRDAMRQFMRANCSGNDYGTWRRPNRRHIGSGLYMPTPVSETVECVVLAKDVSGSCHYVSQQFHTEGLTMAQMLRPKKLVILEWDTNVIRSEIIDINTGDDPVISKHVKLGGGTDINCVPKWLRDNKMEPTACVILTDGIFSGWGEPWDCPILWCIVDEPHMKPTVGQTVHIDTSDERRI